MSDLGNREVLAKNLQRLMNENGINRADLANILKTSYSTINDWYNGKSYPRIDMIEKMAQYFGVSKAGLIEQQHTEAKYADSPRRQFLMDRIAKADEKKLDRIKRLMELVDEEIDNL